ncbi:response regulator transcription factor [Sphingomonas oligophenolica]|uniref:Response regulator n=1 Tax=Sphingomonas oligophenolica TaxID=301154 RepID=A0ABU9Y0B9_9SPHN
MPTILIIDDDVRLAEMLRDYLSEGGFLVETRHSGAAGIEAATRHCADGRGYDAVILDIMLPDIDGLEVCRRLRAQSDVPILMLTARGEDTDRIVGLELGADDYLPKPFNPRELLARLKAILRRRGDSGRDESATLRFGRLEIDAGSRSVRLDGETRILTSYQFDLLLILAQHAGRIMSRERLMDLARGEELEAFDRSIDVHISRLRAVLEDVPARPRRIITVRGAGYVFAKIQDQA